MPSCQQGDVSSRLMRPNHDRGLTAEGIQGGSPLLGSAPLVPLVLKTVVVWGSGPCRFPSEATSPLSSFFGFLPSSCADNGPPIYHMHTHPCFSETQCPPLLLRNPMSDTHLQRHLISLDSFGFPIRQVLLAHVTRSGTCTE